MGFPIAVLLMGGTFRVVTSLHGSYGLTVKSYCKPKTCLGPKNHICLKRAPISFLFLNHTYALWFTTKAAIVYHNAGRGHMFYNNASYISPTSTALHVRTAGTTQSNTYRCCCNGLCRLLHWLITTGFNDSKKYWSVHVKIRKMHIKNNWL
jgi:hypothetical protein